MANISITTSIPPDWWSLAREKHLKWNECMIAGIKLLADKHIPAAYGEIYEKSEDLNALNEKEWVKRLKGGGK